MCALMIAPISHLSFALALLKIRYLSATFSANILQMQFDGEGNLYIGDTFAVRKLVRGATGLEDGTIVTLTESGSVTNTDGLAMDSTCSHIYLSNKSTKSISKVTIE